MSDDDPRWDPPLEQLARVCQATAFLALDTSRLPHREPSGDIAQLDTQFDPEHVVNPLKFAHEATSGYLQGAGDLLHSMGRLIDENPSAVSPSILARSAVEYAALAWWLSDPDESPEQRAAKARRITQTAMNEHALDRKLDDFRRTFNAWSSRTTLKMGKKPDPEKLLRAMHGDAYDDQIKLTSQFVHADPVTLVRVMHSADRKHPLIRQVPWNDGMFALWTIITTCDQVTRLRGGKLTEVREAKNAFNYLTDIVAEEESE